MNRKAKFLLVALVILLLTVSLGTLFSSNRYSSYSPLSNQNQVAPKQDGYSGVFAGENITVWNGGYFVVSSEYIYSDSLLYHKVNTSICSGISWVLIPYSWSFVNCTNGALLAGTGGGDYYRFNFFATPSNVYFVSNSTYSCNWGDDIYSGASWFGNVNQMFPYPYISEDGTDDYISFTAINTRSASFSIWFRGLDQSTINTILSRNWWDLSLRSYSGADYRLSFDVSGGSTWVSGTIVNNTWNHISISYIEGGYLTSWINGTMFTNVSAPASASACDRFYLGSQVGYYWKGYLADFMYYNNTALTNATAYQNYISPITPSLSGMTIWTPFLELSGATAYDISGGNRDGTLQNHAARIMSATTTSDGDLLNLTASANTYTYSFLDYGSVINPTWIMSGNNSLGYFLTDWNGGLSNGSLSSFTETFKQASTRIVLFYANGTASFADYVKMLEAYNPYNTYTINNLTDYYSGTANFTSSSISGSIWSTVIATPTSSAINVYSKVGSTYTSIYTVSKTYSPKALVINTTGYDNLFFNSSASYTVANFTYATSTNNIVVTGDSSSGSLTSVNASGATILYDGIGNIPFPLNSTIQHFRGSTYLSNTTQNGTFANVTYSYSHVENTYYFYSIGNKDNISMNYTVHRVEIDNTNPATWYYAGTATYATTFLVSGFYDMVAHGKWNGGAAVADLKFSWNYTNPAFSNGWNKVSNAQFLSNTTYYIQLSPIYTNASGYDFAIAGSTYVITVVVSTMNITIQNIYWSQSYFSPHDTLSYQAELFFNGSDVFIEGYVLSKVMLYGVPLGINLNSSTVFHNMTAQNVTLYHNPPILTGLWTCAEYIDLEIYDKVGNLISYLYNVTPPFEENPTIATPYVTYASSSFSTYQAINFNYTFAASENVSHWVTVVMYRNMALEIPLYMNQTQYIGSSGNVSGSFSVSPNGIIRQYWVVADQITLLVYGELGDLLATYVLSPPISFSGNGLTFSLTPSKTIVDDTESYSCTILYVFNASDNSLAFADADITWGTISITYPITLQFGLGSLSVGIPPAGINSQPTSLSITIRVLSGSATGVTNSSSTSMTVTLSAFTQLYNIYPTMLETLQSSKQSGDTTWQGIISLLFLSAVVGGVLLFYLGRRYKKEQSSKGFNLGRPSKPKEYKLNLGTKESAKPFKLPGKEEPRKMKRIGE